MSSSSERVIASLAGSQWGMLTAAQATAQGVARSTLLRRERAGALERIRPGVYRLPGAPANRLDDIRAAWLASAPEELAWERLASTDVVVGCAAAAWVHDMGDLYPSPVMLYTARRRQTKHVDIRYSTRKLPTEDSSVVDGLPVTTRERTIADLLDESGVDVSLVADVLRDAERADADLDTDRLISLLEVPAKRLGYGSGARLYGHLRSLTRVDEERFRNLLVHTDLRELVASVANDSIQAALGPLAASLAEQVHSSLITSTQLEAIMAPLRASVLAHVNATVKAAMAPAMGMKMPQVDVPKVKLPAGLLRQLQLPPSTEAALAKLANTSIPRLSPSNAPQPTKFSQAERPKTEPEPEPEPEAGIFGTAAHQAAQDE
jgi:predicted transcriptional regulator of viral defense system